MLMPFWLKSPRNCRASALFLLLPNAPSVCQHQKSLTAASKAFQATGPRASCQYLAYCSVCICKPRLQACPTDYAYGAGIACMFALMHSDLDDKTIQLLQARQAAVAASSADAKPSKVQEAAVAAADASVHSEVPSGPSLELADKVDHAETTATACPGPVSQEVSGNHARQLWVCDGGQLTLITTVLVPSLMTVEVAAHYSRVDSQCKMTYQHRLVK